MTVAKDGVEPPTPAFSGFSLTVISTTLLRNFFGSDQASFITGATIPVDGGQFAGLKPARLSRLDGRQWTRKDLAEGRGIAGQVSRMTERKGAQASPLWLRIGFWACTVIAVAAVVRRLFALAYPQLSAASRTAALDQVFASHATLTVAHILPALAFVLISPFVVFRGSNEKVWSQVLLFPVGIVVGITAYAMSAYSFGGWIERSAVLLFNTLFMFSLCRAYLYRRRGQFVSERRWLVRAIAILLGIATTRPIMGVFFATSGMTHLEPRQFFGIAFWIGFSVNTLLVELWLRMNKRRPVSFASST